MQIQFNNEQVESQRYIEALGLIYSLASKTGWIVFDKSNEGFFMQPSCSLKPRDQVRQLKVLEDVLVRHDVRYRLEDDDSDTLTFTLH